MSVKKLAAYALLLVLAFSSADAGMLQGVVGNVPGSSGPVSVSDNFNRANGGLGANWTTITGLSAPTISGNTIAAALSGAYWSANTFSDNQYSQGAVTASTDAYGALVIVRQSSSANTSYWATIWDDTSGSGHNYCVMYKRITGTDTQLGVSVNCDAYGASFNLRLEASGTTLTYKIGATTIMTRTDSAITSGSAGFASNNANYDNFVAGDL